MRLLQFLQPARHRTGNSLYPNFITRGPVTQVGPATITDALLLLVFCDICSSSLSLSFESLDSIIISNVHYYFQDGRPTRYYNHRYYKPYNIYGYQGRSHGVVWGCLNNPTFKNETHTICPDPLSFFWVMGGYHVINKFSLPMTI